jgi:hypothetical protein
MCKVELQLRITPIFRKLFVRLFYVIFMASDFYFYRSINFISFLLFSFDILLCLYFENVAQFRYFGTTITDQNLIQEEIKRRLNSGNACYHLVQNPLSSRLLSKNIKIRIYKAIILSLVLYGCETLSLTLTEEHRLSVFEKRLLKIFWPKRDEMTGGWKKLHNEELHNLYSSPSIIRRTKSRGMRWAGHVTRTGEKECTYDVSEKVRRKETIRKTKK